MWNASRGFTIQLVHNDTPVDFPNLSHLFPNLFIFPSLFQFCLPGPLCALETIHTIFTLYPHWFLAFSQLSLSWPSQCVHTFLLVVSTGWKACQASTSFILRSGNRTPFSCTKATVCNTQYWQYWPSLEHLGTNMFLFCLTKWHVKRGMPCRQHIIVDLWRKPCLPWLKHVGFSWSKIGGSNPHSQVYNL